MLRESKKRREERRRAPPRALSPPPQLPPPYLKGLQGKKGKAKTPCQTPKKERINGSPDHGTLVGWIL
jgi:hypothetical protein